jgi:foldase protein PrsA
MSLNKRARLSALIGLALIMLFTTACGNEPKAGEEGIVATYQGGTISQEELDTFVNVQAFLYPPYAEYYRQPEFMEQNVKQLIAQKLLAERAGTDGETEQKAKENYKTMRESFVETLGSEEELKNRMQQEGVTEEVVTQYFVQIGLVEKYFRDRLDTEAVQQQYEESKEQYTVVTVSHILIATTSKKRSEEEAKKIATEVLQKLKAGADFAELAKQYSDDPGSKDAGGTYADSGVMNWVPEFKEAALTLPINEISDLVKTDHGYHIMLVSKREVSAFEEVKEQVEAGIMQKDFTQFTEAELPGLIDKIVLPEPQPDTDTGADNGASDDAKKGTESDTGK